MTTLLEPLRPAAPPPTAADDRRVRHDWLLVGLMLLVYVALQSAFVRLPPLSDQMHYFLDASTLPAITEPPHQALRIGLTIPVWLLIQVFDYSEAAYYAVPWLSTAGLIVVTYWLGRLVDSRVTGVIAGLLIVANPIVLDDASQLLPDIPATLLLTAAVTVLLWWWRRTGGVDPRTRVDHAVLLGVGLALGWSYLVREFVVLWFPVVALVLWALRAPRSWWRLVAVGAALPFVLELAWGAVFFGNPFARIVAALNQPASEPWRVVERDALIASGAIPDTHVEMLTAMPRALVEWDAGWVLVGLFVVLVVGALLTRGPQLRLLAAWVIVPLVLMLGVIEFAWLFDNRILRAEKLRYWMPLIPPLVVGGVTAARALGARALGARALGARALGARAAGTTGRAVATVAVALALVTGIALTGAQLDERLGYTRTGQDEYLEFREWAVGPGRTCPVIWADADHWRAATRWVPMYVRSFWGRPVWDGELRPLNVGDDFVDLDALDTGALVRSRTSLERRKLEAQVVPSWLQEPPGSWRVLLETDRDRVRVLGVGGSTCARP